jgi:hypothetical protein
MTAPRWSRLDHRADVHVGHLCRAGECEGGDHGLRYVRGLKQFRRDVGPALVAEDSSLHLRRGPARIHREHADSVWVELGPEGVREGPQGVLGGRVEAGARPGFESRARVHEDDLASGCAESRREPPGHEKRGADVRRPEAVEVSGPGTLERCRAVDPAAMDEQVEPATAASEVPQERGVGFGVDREIGREDECPGADPMCGALQRSQVPAEKTNACAALGQSLGDCGPDTATGSGDESPLSNERLTRSSHRRGPKTNASTSRRRTQSVSGA